MKRKLDGPAGGHGHMELGRKYPVLLNARSLDDRAVVLQYGFKPANVATSHASELCIGAEQDDGEAKVHARTDEGKDLLFRGSNLSSLTATGGQHEYILQFDPSTQTCSLIKVDVSISNLRPQLQTGAAYTSIASTKAADQGLRLLAKSGRRAAANKSAKIRSTDAVDPSAPAAPMVDRVSRPVVLEHSVASDAAAALTSPTSPTPEPEK